MFSYIDFIIQFGISLYLHQFLEKCGVTPFLPQCSSSATLVQPHEFYSNMNIKVHGFYINVENEVMQPKEALIELKPKKPTATTTRN